MELRHITAYVATCEEGSINRAAQRLGIAQPSISATLRDLESELGLTLLERTARGAEPTAAGQTFYTHCLRVLSEVDAARNAVVGGGGRVAGPVRVGLAPTIAKGLMPRFVSGYLERYPDVQLRIAEAFSGPLTEWTLSGEVDFAVVAVPPVDRRLITRRLAPDPMLLISAADGLASRPSSVPERPIKLALPSPRNGLRGTIDRYVQSVSLPVERTIEIDSLHGTLELVKRSDWVTILSLTSIVQELGRGELAARRVQPPLELEFYLIHPARRALSTAAVRFIEDLEAAFELTSREKASIARRMEQSPA